MQIAAVSLTQFGKHHFASAGIGQIVVAIFHDVALTVSDHHRYRVIILYDGEEKFYVGGRILLREAFGGFGPYLHTRAFLLGQVFDQVVGYEQEYDDCRYGYKQENHLTHSLSVIESVSHDYRMCFKMNDATASSSLVPMTSSASSIASALAFPTATAQSAIRKIGRSFILSPKATMRPAPMSEATLSIADALLV